MTIRTGVGNMMKHTLRRAVLAAAAALIPAGMRNTATGSAIVTGDDETESGTCNGDGYPDGACADGAGDGFAGTAAGSGEDRNRDIFDDPDIELDDLEDLRARYLAARLRDGNRPASGEPLRPLERAPGTRREPHEPPSETGGDRRQTVQDLIRHHFQNRDW